MGHRAGLLIDCAKSVLGNTVLVSVEASHSCLDGARSGSSTCRGQHDVHDVCVLSLQLASRQLTTYCSSTPHHGGYIFTGIDILRPLMNITTAVQSYPDLYFAIRV
jgi:hypothetical protein